MQNCCLDIIRKTKKVFRKRHMKGIKVFLVKKKAKIVNMLSKEEKQKSSV